MKFPAALPPPQVTVALKINQRKQLTDDEVHLNMDIVTTSGNQLVPGKIVLIKMQDTTKRIAVPYGIVNGSEVILNLQAGTRGKLLAWAEGSEGQVSEYDIFPDDYESAVRSGFDEEKRITLKDKEESLVAQFTIEKESEKAQWNSLKLELEATNQQLQDELNNLKKAKVQSNKAENEVLELNIKSLTQEVSTLKDALQELEAKMYPQKKTHIVNKTDVEKDLRKKLMKSKKVEIQSDEVVRLSADKYQINAQIIIQEGAELIIDAGATLEFGPFGGIISYGKLTANGEKDNYIIFTSQDSNETRPWRNITLYGKGASGSKIEYALIEHGAGRELIIDKDSGVYYPKPDNMPRAQSYGGALVLLYVRNIEVKNVRMGNCTFEKFEGVIYSNTSSMTLEDSIIDDCKYGGISAVQSSLVMRSNLVVNNSFGVRFEASVAVMDNNILKNNSGYGLCIIDCKNLKLIGGEIANNKGAGIEMRGSTVSIEVTTIKNNKNGGINVSKSTGDINDCQIVNNKSEHKGGGLSLIESAFDISNCNISGNSSLEMIETGKVRAHEPSTRIIRVFCDKCNDHHETPEQYYETLPLMSPSSEGGGIYLYGGSAQISKSKISENIANSKGAGLSSRNSTVIINDSIISKNECEIEKRQSHLPTEGGGIYLTVDNNVLVAISNTIVEENRAVQHGGIIIIAPIVKMGTTTRKRTVRRKVTGLRSLFVKEEDVVQFESVPEKISIDQTVKIENSEIRFNYSESGPAGIQVEGGCSLELPNTKIYGNLPSNR